MACVNKEITPSHAAVTAEEGGAVKITAIYIHTARNKPLSET